ncbi:MAG: hypothetical protein KTR14_10625 [Vampirovibrio sp.]|nr:hypothetical protein [Vampirovibrio sp.]
MICKKADHKYTPLLLFTLVMIFGLVFVSCQHKEEPTSVSRKARLNLPPAYAPIRPQLPPEEPTDTASETDLSTETTEAIGPAESTALEQPFPQVEAAPGPPEPQTIGPPALLPEPGPEPLSDSSP